LKKLYLSLFILSVVFHTNAQNDAISSRIIFIGDAGEKSVYQQKIILDASEKIIPGKTTVFYLGDNIYPRGMGLPGSKDEINTQQILQSQFVPMRNKAAVVYFIPGNHDWDRMGVNGLEKIIAQNSFLKAQNDSLLQMVPANGCPGPTAINIGDSLTIIAFDSEWWLFRHNKNNPNADCDCNTKKEFTDKLLELLYKNRYKVILLAAHHPFQTYGHHGGYFSITDHLFPLTAASKNLYIPLPVIGSLYPLLRTIIINPEDKKHPLYKAMIKQVDEVTANFPNLLHVAGHEHGLQFIKNDQTQIVSGAGAKKAFVKKGKDDALFTANSGGYVIADLLAGNQLKLTYYVAEAEGKINEGFSFVQPYINIKKLEDSLYNAVAANNADSITVQANAAYNKVSKFHRKIFGENYRKEWAAGTKLPVIKLSSFKGGLTSLQRGGGHQSLSLRLQDSTGKEWVLRSVNKYPEILLPETLRETFAKDIITDAMSAQHPYSALVVPVLADVVGIPHATPVIGWVAPDKMLGIYQKDFMNTVCLLEEREPLGKSDNSQKMYKELLKDNDNSIDSTLLLKAKLLDLLLGDWDRHEDQWRWAYTKDGKGKKYIPVPRDRDQVFHIMEGVLPNFISRPWIFPLLHDFDGKIKKVNAFFTESDSMSRRLLNQFSYQQWMEITQAFTRSITDDILENAISRLPNQVNNSNAKILSQLKERRKNIPAAMSKYYYFLNKIVDIQTTDKNEFITITNTANNELEIVISKINKEGKIKEQLYKRIFDPSVTKEIRLYVHDGDDSVFVDDNSGIKLRIIGNKGEKKYTVVNSSKKLYLYGRVGNVTVDNKGAKIKQHLSNKKLNTLYIPTNSYNKIIPSLIAGYNLDDGLMLGASVKFINQGFRKKPYASMQQLSFSHAFSSEAYKINFHSEWLQAAGKKDILLQVKLLAPDNTQNFFGIGNNTSYNKVNTIKYYRARFSIYQADLLLRKQYNNSTLSAGPSLQYYRFDADDNKGRFINNNAAIGSYDSTNITADKAFAGVIIKFVKDTRNNKLMPLRGAYLAVKTLGYTGINSNSKNFMQIIPELCFYKKISRRGNIVFANRTGAGITWGKTAFYQSQFLGGHENLYGYRQYRFAGNHMLYNNAELRIKIAQAGNYILPGQLGLVAFYDAGKVWASGNNSKKVHQGAGGGIYFSPAQIAVLQLVMGHSTEGWYPYFSLGFRF
jgi:hypothetical protein